MGDEKYLIKGGEQPRGDSQENLIIQPGQEGVPIQPMRVQIQKGFDKNGRPIHRAITTISETPEEHIYLIYRGATADKVIEIDLLGDQTIVGSDGKLPPIIHIECPQCSVPDPPGTKPEDSKRSLLSITYGNKHFEIEDLPTEKWGLVTFPDGRPVMNTQNKPAIQTRLLTVKEMFRCTYCQRRFRITDNIISDA